MIFIDFMATNRRSKGERLVLVQVLNQRDQWGLFSAPLFMRMNLEMSCKDPALYFYAKYLVLTFWFRINCDLAVWNNALPIIFEFFKI